NRGLDYGITFHNVPSEPPRSRGPGLHLTLPSVLTACPVVRAVAPHAPGFAPGPFPGLPPGRIPMSSRPLRFFTFLAPTLAGVYRFIARHVGRKLGRATELVAGSHYGQLREANVAFVCGLAYVEFRDGHDG